MGIIESELANALNGGAVKRKRNATGKIRVKAARVVKPKESHSSEVMVKITGFGKGGGHVKAHLTYISRNGKIELENEQGDRFNGRDEVGAAFKGWSNSLDRGNARANQRDTMHMVLSMPEMTDPEAVRKAARDFAKATFSENHEYVFALHHVGNDKKTVQPHVHIAVKMEGHDGTRLNPRKGDLQQWREGFASALLVYGVDAVATPRVVRGVVRKAENSVVRHIEKGDATHKPRISAVRVARIQQAKNEILEESNVLSAPKSPLKAALEVVRERVVKAWNSAADALETPKKNITFNKQKATNERPDYERINTTSADAIHRLAAVQQSDIGANRRSVPTLNITSLRDLSSINLVHDQRRAEMLLHKDALNYMGGQRGTNSEMRRTGVGPVGAHGGSIERLSDASLAQKIRGFVSAMPPVETAQEALKEKLKAGARELSAKVKRDAAPTPHGNVTRPIDKGVDL